MIVNRYDIIMRTPLGERQGQLRLAVKGRQISGNLDILGHTNPICGRMEADGRCRLEGQVVTLLRTLPFTADGRVDSDSVDLTLRGGQHEFQIQGAPITQEGEA